MLNTKLNEKSALARLLATENLSVQYSTKYPTAFFDLKSRTIHIPLIANLDEDLLDLFEGHEVGHARETPAEGFHSAIEQDGQIDHVLKTYLNVVEDIRIERKIKNEYPGFAVRLRTPTRNSLTLISLARTFRTVSTILTSSIV